MKRSQHPLRRTRSVFVAAALFLAAGSMLEAARIDAAENALVFEIENQYGEVYTSDAFEGRSLVLIGGDRAARQATRSWALAVGELVGEEESKQDVAVLRVADLRSVPGFLKGKVREQIRRRMEASLLLDWDGVIVEPLEFRKSRANVLIIDRSGEVKVRLEAGEPRADEVTRVREALEALERANLSSRRPDSEVILLGSRL